MDSRKPCRHTGDIGVMDADGVFYFRLWEKRMIKPSGMDVCPDQVEEQLYKHPAVKEACAIGVPDEKQVERVKGFVVLNDPAQAGPAMAHHRFPQTGAGVLTMRSSWSVVRALRGLSTFASIGF